MLKRDFEVFPIPVQIKLRRKASKLNISCNRHMVT
jgi:hypothetical protein